MKRRRMTSRSACERTRVLGAALAAALLVACATAEGPGTSEDALEPWTAPALTANEIDVSVPSETRARVREKVARALDEIVLAEETSQLWL